MKPRIDGVRVVAFTPKSEPPKVSVPDATLREGREAAGLVIRMITKLARIVETNPESVHEIHEFIDFVLARETRQRKPRKNLGKPVIDLTGDDREGA